MTDREQIAAEIDALARAALTPWPGYAKHVDSSEGAREDAHSVASGPALSPVEMAVFAGCVAHTRCCFSPVTPDAWWRAPAPFRGERAAFARHLRRLDEAGVLYRLMGETARYVLTLAGEDLARHIAVPDDQEATP